MTWDHEADAKVRLSLTRSINTNADRNSFSSESSPPVTSSSTTKTLPNIWDPVSTHINQITTSTIKKQNFAESNVSERILGLAALPTGIPLLFLLRRNANAAAQRRTPTVMAQRRTRPALRKLRRLRKRRTDLLSTALELG
ncbi:conserved hypothetical protein [Aspergillus fumigatus A1163]|uniref:Uncharacterized protein n=1 Tax=Aspergillus fumigatus (strain CBS 144.89 / FGSC A1163 / CEA10) TaxID=451804 RepID=B0XRJ5_ASPFC|nr:conserved hypothetical protein [Aspergillus fumigatus A1163]